MNTGSERGSAELGADGKRGWNRARIVLLSIVALLVVVTACWFLVQVVLFFGPSDLLPSTLGTGGYVAYRNTKAPYPFSLDVPRFWRHRVDDRWGDLFLGEIDPAGIAFTRLTISIFPSVEQCPPGGGQLGSIACYESLDRFVQATLQPRPNPVVEGAREVAGRPALDLPYSYSEWAGPVGPSAPYQGRSVFFEDRGHFYRLEYAAAVDKYDRDFSVFETAIRTFKFIK